MDDKNNYSLSILSSYKRAYKKLPDDVKNMSKETLKHLVSNPFHPGLRTKKNNQASKKFKSNVYESSVNMQYRILWKFEDGKVILLLLIGDHAIVTDKKYR